ncbi:MAG: exonuclease SbcCD subunit D [Fusobacteria bacterium]|nr:exonuclease SbcCD subunit D [Fusobacteriota bacterium]
MKLLHLADLHIGKKLNGHSLIEDQRAFFSQMYECVKVEQIDVIVIAGDIYDRSVPSEEATTLFDDVIYTLCVELKRKVVAIAGNHDSAVRLDFSRNLLARQGFYIIGEYRELVNMIEIEGVQFFFFPFVEPVTIREMYKSLLEAREETLSDYNETMKFIVESAYPLLDKHKKSVALFHGFVIGVGDTLEREESVKALSVGGKEYVSVDIFAPFDYVALGHLHGARQVKREGCRYCGSPIKYSFSEKSQKKVLTVVEIGSDINVKEVEIVEHRPMIEVRGSVSEILNSAISPQSYLKVTLTQYELDAMNRLRSKYENVLELGMDIVSVALSEREVQSSEIAKLSVVELFQHFSASVGIELEEAETHYLESVAERVGER